MERNLRSIVAAVLSLAIAACGTQETAAGAGDAPTAAALRSGGPGGHRQRLEVMTRNLYLGADILPLTQVTTPEESVAVTTELWAKVQATDFPSRARVIADEVLRARPDVLGLQEVTLYRSGPPRVCAGEVMPDQPVAARVELDFLAILQRELRHRGLHYRVAAKVASLDAEFCMLDPRDPRKLRDLRYTDHDVLLVRDDVDWRPATLPVPTSTARGDSNGALYAQDWTAYFQIGPATIYSWRAWLAIEVKVGDGWVRLFETHLEDWLEMPPEVPLPPWVFQAGQAGELVSILDGSLAMAPLPVVVLGDFNAYVTPEQSPPVYRFLTGGIFPLDPALDGASPLADAWTALHPGDPGFTWGFDEMLRTGSLFTRLDLVLVTGNVEPEYAYLVGTRDRTWNGLHPSDHAGIVTGVSIR